MRFLGFFILLFCLSGCGYHFSGYSGTLPGGVEKLYIPLFINKTIEPRLETRITSQVSEIFSRNDKIHQVEKKADAEAVLYGTIRQYKSRALSYSRNDDIGTYLSTMIVDVELRQTGSKQLLWSSSIQWKETYRASGDKNIQDLARQQTLQQLILRVAEEIHSRLLDDF